MGCDCTINKRPGRSSPARPSVGWPCAAQGDLASALKQIDPLSVEPFRVELALRGFWLLDEAAPQALASGAELGSSELMGPRSLVPPPLAQAAPAILGAALGWACTGAQTVQPGMGAMARAGQLTEAEGPRVLPHDLREGFVLWEVRDASLVKSGANFVASSQVELERYWRRFELRPPVPNLDFTKQIVLSFVELSLCSGGQGGREIERLRLWRDGWWQPELAAPIGSVACPEAAAEPGLGVIYVMAVPRRTLFDGQPPRRMMEPRTAPPPIATRTATCRVVTGPSPRHLDSEGLEEQSLLSVPEPGGVLLQYLRDGSPVFVVGHREGEIEVFAGDLRPFELPIASDDTVLRGLARPLFWDCSTRRFSGQFDEYGKPVLTTPRRPMDQYAFTFTRDGRVLVNNTSRHSSSASGRVAPRGPFVVPVEGMEAFSDWPTLSLSQARSLAPGNLAKFEALLVVGGGQPPRFCSGRNPTVHSCRSGAPRALGVRASRRTSAVGIPGRFVGRLHQAGFDQVVVLEVQGSLGTQAPASRPYGHQFPEISGGFSGLFGFSGGERNWGRRWILGGELKAELRTSLWDPHQWPNRPHRERYLIGYDLGLGIRGRFWGEPANGQASWWLGLDPLLESPSYRRRWIAPSVLGLLLPEVGLGRNGLQTFPYIGWTFPVEWRWISPRQRKHPYNLRDVLGIQGSLLWLVPLTQPLSERVLGVTLGLSFSP